MHRAALTALSLAIALPVAGCKTKPKEPPKKAPAPGALPEGVLRKPLVVPRYGSLQALHPVPVADAQGVVLLLSDRPDPQAPEIARRAIVIEIPTRLLRRQGEADPSRCWYMAGELEAVAQSAERMLGLEDYRRPLLYADGTAAALGYLALAQAPAEMFSGLIATDLRLQVDFRAPFCEREGWKAWSEGGVILLSPRPAIAPRPDGTPRLRLAPANQVDLSAFIAEMPAAAPLQPERAAEEIHAWLASSGQPIADTRPGPESLHSLDLPLIVNWPEDPRSVLLYLTDSGGWTEPDRLFAESFVRSGHAVVALDTLRYLWSPRSPLQAATDLSRVLNALPLDLHLFIGGRGAGASVAAATLRRLDSAAAARLNGAVLLSPTAGATFEIGQSDRLSGDAWPIRDVLLQRPVPILCVHPADDPASPCLLPGAQPADTPGAETGGKVAGGKVAGGKVAGGKVAGGKEAGGKVAGGKVAGGKEGAPPLVARALPGGATYGGDMATVAHTALAFMLERLPAPGPARTPAKDR